MKYSSNDYEEDVPYDQDPDQYYTIYYTVNILEYDSSKNTGNIIPRVVNGNAIDRVRCTLTYGDNNGSDCLIFIKTSQQYSKIILNGGPFKNCSIPYNGNTANNGVRRFYTYSSDSIPGIDYDNWEKYNETPFDLTIKFVY